MINVIGHQNFLYEIQWFQFQVELMHALENSTNIPNDLLLKSLLKWFAFFMVAFDCKQKITGPHLVGIAMKCINCK